MLLMAATIWGRMSPPSPSSTSAPVDARDQEHALLSAHLRPEGVDAEFAPFQSGPGVARPGWWR